MICCSKNKSQWKLAICLTVVLGVASFALLSDALGETAPADFVEVTANVVCPVTTGERIDPDISTTYNGREVYFCCQRCKRKFERDPQPYVSKLPANYFASATLHPEASVTTTSDETNQAGAKDQPHANHNAHDHGNNTASQNHGHVHETGDARHDDDGASTGGAHDHSSHGQDESQGLLRHFIGWAGKFHPPSVNFPIALIVASLVAEALFMVTGQPMFDAAGRFTVWFAILGTIGAVILGWFFGGFKLIDDEWLMTTHRWVGTAAGLCALVLAWFASKEWSGSRRNPARNRSGYRLALLVATVLISANGFFGGALMYGIDHYLW